MVGLRQLIKDQKSKIDELDQNILQLNEIRINQQ
jgi:hypothetical protein